MKKHIVLDTIILSIVQILIGFGIVKNFIMVILLIALVSLVSYISGTKSIIR